MIRNAYYLFFAHLSIFYFLHAETKTEVFRLPKSVKPLRYVLTMEPKLTVDSFDPIPYFGSVTIELETVASTNNITLHSKDIDIDEDSVKISDAKGNKLIKKSTSNDSETETFTVHLGSPLAKGNFYNLTIGNFSSKLKRDEGFFSAYYWVKKEMRSLAVTHFEPTGARRAFPCFDEPNLKATFIINLIRTEKYTSVSNKELDRTENLGDGRFKDTFKETPLMSTFLVAFAISDFNYTRSGRHRIFAQPETVSNLEYALNISEITLRKLEDYFGLNFTLEKLDAFAVPASYFEESAMENWGLVVYDERYLKRTAQTNVEIVKEITTFAAHEFSHQWFGNLVTPEWWDYLWLSEAFATYFQYYVASLVEPSWNLVDEFLMDMHYEAFAQEDTYGSYPMSYPIKKSGHYLPFHIMYEKGGAVVRMISYFITPQVFQKGLQIYLKENQFKNTVPSNLYSAFQKALDESGKGELLGKFKMAEIMETWEWNSGFPIVTVTRNYTDGGVTFEQSTRFNQSSASKGLWNIPITYAFSSDEKSNFSDTTTDFWFDTQKQYLNQNFSIDGWLIVNKQHSGYYRVNYDLENWHRIIETLKSEKFSSIHPYNRAQLIYDAIYLAYYDYIPLEIALDMAEFLVREKEYVVFASFYQGISNYLNIYKRDPKSNEDEYFRKHPLFTTVTPPEEGGYTQEYKTFQQYIRNITRPIRNSLGNSFVDQLHKNKIDTYFPMYFVYEYGEKNY